MQRPYDRAVDAMPLPRQTQRRSRAPCLAYEDDCEDPVEDHFASASAGGYDDGHRAAERPGVAEAETMGETEMGTVGAGPVGSSIVGVRLTSTIVVGVTPPGSCEARSSPASTVATTAAPAAMPPQSCCQSLFDVCVVSKVALCQNRLRRAAPPLTEM